MQVDIPRSCCTTYTGKAPCPCQQHWSELQWWAGEVSMADDERARKLLDAGLRLLRSWDYEGAIRAFTEALRLDPGLAEAYENRALAYRRLGRDEEAEDDLGKSRSVLRDGVTFSQAEAKPGIVEKVAAFLRWFR